MLKFYFKNKKFALSLLFTISFLGLYAQTYNFSTAGAISTFGPTQSQINIAYAGTNLAGQVTSVNGIQEWQVPFTGLYSIQALGAAGGGVNGGLGASITGEVILNGGDIIQILVGQQGTVNDNGTGGGGGSYVVFSGNPFIIAGGGGGNNGVANADCNGQDGPNGKDGSGTTFGVGGTAGNQGISTNRAQGGAGWLQDGPVLSQATTDSPAKRFLNGGDGGFHIGSPGGLGGFGGGGGSWNTGFRGSAGGGGYSGGGTGSVSANNNLHYGGGAGSFNSGTNQNNLAGIQAGNGQVIITVLSSGATNDIGVTSVDAPTIFCPGSETVLATIFNFSINQITSATINWAVDGVLQTPVSFSGLLDTVGGSGSTSSQVNLGVFNFSTNSPYNLEAWTSNPNGVTDTVSNNDSTQVTLQSSLPAPTNIVAQSLLGNQATITWTGGATNSWLWVNVPAGNPIAGTGTSSSSPIVTVTGLTSETAYDFYVREVCSGGDTSAWAGPFFYVTPFLCPQNAYCFLTGGASGQFGPSQAQINAVYNATPLSGQVVVNGGIQEWTVPAGGLYEIEVYGAQGYGPFGGRGAKMKGDFLLTGGDILKVLVGQKGAPPIGSGTNQFGGGGGSFITDITDSPLIIAGGGGGSWAPSYTSITDATTSSTQGNSGGGVGSTGGAGGTPGFGGLASVSGDGGGGLLTNGIGNAGGFAFVNGGAGGIATGSGGEGGFGGGGGASSFDNRRAGGGGGYSGGGGAHGGTTGFPEGGGGGSFNAGTNQDNVAGLRFDDGVVIIRALSSGAPNDIGIVGIDSPAVFCPGVESVWASLNNFGTTQVTSATVNWSVDGVLQTPASFSGLLDTIGGTGNTTAQLLLGTFNFATNNPYNVSVWTSNPNGASDTVTQNDTASRVIQSSLPAPGGLAFTNLLPNSVDVTWNPGSLANSWLWVVVPAGTPPTGIGTAVTSATALVSGINSNTNYDFYVREVCPSGDTSAWAGPLNFLTPCSIYGNPFVENFDGFQWDLVSPFPIDQCWTKTPPAPVTGYRWQTEDGQPTSGTTTGPSGDVSGIGKYVYTESSSGSLGNIAELETPLIDISNLSAPQAEFYYHMHGATTGSMAFEVFDNGIWVNLWSQTGPQQASNTDPWIQVNIPFTTTSDTVKFRFVGTRGSSFTSDMAIDEFSIFQPIPNDFSVIGIDSLNSGCGLTATEALSAKIRNFGTATFNSGFTFPIVADVNGILTIETVSLSTSFAPGDTLDYIFTNTFDLSVPTTYNIKVYTQLPGDSSNINDTLFESIINIPVISSFPYYQDFESGNGGWTAGGPNSTWALGTPAGAVINSASSGSNAWATNLTGNYNNSEQSFVLGPCFDFTNLVLPLIKMDANWNSENSWDGMKIEASTDAGSTWNQIGAFGDPFNWYNDNSVNGLAFTGIQEGWTGTAATGSNGWLTAKNDLTTYAGNSGVLMRVVFGSDGSVNGFDGVAFDNFHILESPSNDIAVDSLIGLQSGCGYSDSTIIRMRVTNFGITPQTNVPVFYTVNGVASPVENIPTTINPGATLIYQFTNAADLSVPQLYTIIGRSALATDEDTTNDSSPAKIFQALFTPQVLSVTDGETCESGPVTLSMTSNGDTDRWFTSPFGGTAVGTGSTFTIPNVTKDTTLYVQTTMNATGCNSASAFGRIAVTAKHSTTPVINYTTAIAGTLIIQFTSSLSSNVDSVLWDFGDGTTDNTPNPFHAFPSSKSYLVTLTAYAGSCVADTSKGIFVPVGGINDKSMTNLMVYPNPSEGAFRISADGFQGEVILEIISITGTVIYSEKVEATNGELNHDVYLENISSGTYILKLQNDQTIINGRILIE